MKIAFDANIPVGIVKVFDVLAKEGDLSPVTKVVSARQYTVTGESGDEPWVRRYAQDGGNIIISGDKKMRSRVHERAALLEEGMIVFFFAPKWSEKNVYVKSAMLLNWWPKIIDELQEISPPAMREIPCQWGWAPLRQVTGPMPGR